MAPLSPAAIWSLSALTIHFSILSITLHISRNKTGISYKPSSVIILTEVMKIIICVFLTLITKELTLIPNPGGEKSKSHFQDTIPTYYSKLSESEKEDQTSDPSVLRIDTELAQKSTPTFRLQPPTPNSPLKSPNSILNFSTLHPVAFSLDNSSSTSTTKDLIISIWSELWSKAYWSKLNNIVFSKGWWKLGIPSFLFIFQANAQYVASGHLSVPLFQLAYQLKIPATALCSVLLLKRSLSSQQWFSLFILTLGVGIVQLNIASTPTPIRVNTPAPSTLLTRSHLPSSGHKEQNQFLGLVAVIAACISSGFASTYFEKMLKSTPMSSPFPSTLPKVKPSIWIRNIQLSLFGLVIALPLGCIEIMKNWEFPIGSNEILQEQWFETGWGIVQTGVQFYNSFFAGFDCLTWFVIILQVSGGLLGALVMQHADNISKCFSTSISILLSFALSMWLFNFELSLGVAVGSSFVLLATYFYGSSPTKRRI